MTTCWLLCGVLLAGQGDAAMEGQTPTDVHRLVRQLDSAQPADRDAAEAELLRRGPAILPLLPATTDQKATEASQRLARILQRLQQAAVEAAARASTITLHDDAIPLSSALVAMQEQSGNVIVDDRAKFGHPVVDPTLRLDFDQTPFWPALDQILDQAKLTIYPFGEQRAICVVDAPGGDRTDALARVAYSGPFRFEPIRVLSVRDFHDLDAQSLRVVMQVAWEPRLKIIYLRQAMADVHAVDHRGDPLPVADPDAQLEATISGNAPAVELTMPFVLPPRNVHKIAGLKGTLAVVMAGRTETFRFDSLTTARNVAQRIAEATVTLEQVRKNPAGCEVFVRVRFDNAADALASHRTWIFNNEAYLEGPDGKRIACDSYETTLQRKDEVGVAFRFFTRQSIGSMAFVYKTPGAIMDREFEYELRDLALP